MLRNPIWNSGARIDEVQELRTGHVDDEQGTLQLPNLKQRRRSQKAVYVSPDLATQLPALARNLRIGVDGYLFQSRENQGVPMSRFRAYRIIAVAAQRAQVLKISPRSGKLVSVWPHTFHHSAAKCHLEQTLRLHYVQDQLGHATPETTKQYICGSPTPTNGG